MCGVVTVLPLKSICAPSGDDSKVTASTPEEGVGVGVDVGVGVGVAVGVGVGVGNFGSTCQDYHPKHGRANLGGLPNPPVCTSFAGRLVVIGSAAPPKRPVYYRNLRLGAGGAAEASGTGGCGSRNAGGEAAGRIFGTTKSGAGGPVNAGAPEGSASERTPARPRAADWRWGPVALMERATPQRNGRRQLAARRRETPGPGKLPPR